MLQPATPLTACQKLEMAWSESLAETAPEARMQKQLEIIKILSNEIMGFRPCDAQTLRRLADLISQHLGKDSKLAKKVAKLAERMTGLTWELPNELIARAQEFVSPLQRNGINRSNREWAAEARRNCPHFVNEPNEPIGLDRLLLLLAQCGKDVEDLDFFRLLTERDATFPLPRHARNKADSQKDLLKFRPSITGIFVIPYSGRMSRLGNIRSYFGLVLSPARIKSGRGQKLR